VLSKDRRKLKACSRSKPPQEYLDVIGSCRNPPFTFRNGEVKDFEAVLKPHFKSTCNVEISKAAMLIYNTDGSIVVHKNYGMVNGKSFHLLRNKNLSQDLFENMPCEVMKGVSDLKKKDVLSLLPYVKSHNRSFYTDFLNKIETTSSTLLSDDSDESHLDY